MSADGGGPVTLKTRPIEPEYRRTLQPVRRGSRYSGRERAVALTRRDATMRQAVLERIVKDTKQPGKRAGAPGTLSLYTEKVFGYLADLAVKFEGRVYPSYKQIAAWVRCTVRTAVACVAQLVARGWIEYDRRMEPTGEPGVRGPQVKQISNWYRVLLPKVAQQMLAKWQEARERKEPDAQAHDRAQRQAFLRQCAEVEEDERRRGANPKLYKVLDLWKEAFGEAAPDGSERDFPEGSQSGVRKIK